MVTKIGDHFYNLWRDAANPKGLWRRTTLAEYRKQDPAWEIVLDLDALSAKEGENWVWHGASVLEPAVAQTLPRVRRETHGVRRLLRSPQNRQQQPRIPPPLMACREVRRSTRSSKRMPLPGNLCRPPEAGF